MADDDAGDKTELPTDRRRSEAREKGNVARSVDLNAASHMLAAVAAMFFLGAALTQSVAELMHVHLKGSGWRKIDPVTVQKEFWELAEWSAASVLPWLMLMAVAAVAINLAQVGFLLAPDTLQPKLSRLNPLEGAKRILSVRGLVRLAVSLGKLGLLVVIAALFITSELPKFRSLIDAEVPAIMSTVGQSNLELGFWLALALIVLAVADYAFQKWKHEQDLRMSKQEVRDEMKNMEGDPHIRQRRREAHRKLAEAREMQQVQDADVIITNPTHISVALKYDPDKMDAPTVVAKGMGEMAARIRHIAAEHGVPIIERKELARSLYRDVKVGQTIPVDLYEVFVEIMAYVYRISGRTPDNLD